MSAEGYSAKITGQLFRGEPQQARSRRRDRRRYEKLDKGKLGLVGQLSHVPASSVAIHAWLIQFSFATRCDYFLIVVGTIASIVHGAGFPLLSIVLGGIALNHSLLRPVVSWLQHHLGMTTVFLRAQNSAFVTGVPSNSNSSGTADGVESISRCMENHRRIGIIQWYSGMSSSRMCNCTRFTTSHSVPLCSSPPISR